MRTGVTLTDAVAASLREACRASGDHVANVIAGRRAISQAIVDGHDLAAMWRESDPDKRLPGRYRRHQVVTDEAIGFTVVVLLWEPGACTPIHDHDTWCVFGVLEGALEITNYAIVDDTDGARLVLRESDREVLAAGILGDNRDPALEVHRVRNIGSSRAISLHVYGADLTQRTLFAGRGIRIDGKGACMAFQDSPAY